MQPKWTTKRSEQPTNNVKFAIGVITALVLVWGIRAAHADTLTFQNVINPRDPTFNQELGINNSGVIAGYFGSGNAGSPNKGYTTSSPYTSFTNENFPGSVQTQVTGINESGTTVGFWSNTNLGVGLDSNFGFVDVGGVFTNVNDPNTATGVTPVFNQLLGVNNSNIAVGFYVDAMGGTFGYTYNVNTGTFSAPVSDPDSIPGTTTTAAINNSGELGGLYTNASTDTVDGFLDNNGTFETLAVPGATMTELLGLNDNGYAVGFDQYASGVMFGIICNTTTLTCLQESDPNGIGFTTFNGINDENQIVGFYMNAAGSTIGLETNGVIPTPEPSCFGLLAFGSLAMGAICLRRRSVSKNSPIQ
jgi:hypothetical protein